MQTKLDSLKESIANIAIGLGIAIIAQKLYFYAFDIEATLAQNLGLAAWMTLISLTRSYGIRRWYNRKLINKLKRENNVR